MGSLSSPPYIMGEEPPYKPRRVDNINYDGEDVTGRACRGMNEGTQK